MIGISAIESDGSLRDFDLREVKVAQTIIGQSREVWLAADHSKFSRQAMVELARLNQIDRLFTDVQPSAPSMRCATPKCSARLRNDQPPAEPYPPCSAQRCGGHQRAAARHRLVQGL